MKTLLFYAKEWKVWHKYWGHAAFTVKIPNKSNPQGEKMKYIHMVQTHGSIQLSMGTAVFEGMIDMDTTFKL
jgi:hypothetical protein